MIDPVRPLPRRLLDRLLELRIVEVQLHELGVALAGTCRDEREMLRRFGVIRGRRLQQRLKALRSAETLADMRNLPGRCHELHGDLAGCLSLDLDHPYRLVFRPAGVTRHGRGGGLDWSAVRAVVVVGIADTHE